MNTNRDLDRLDEAIDQVAARLTHVEDNPALTSRIVSSLPERAGWLGWWFHSWAPRLAMIAIVVASGIVWISRRPEVPSPISTPLASAPSVTTPSALVASVGEAEPNRAMPLERVERVERLEPVELSRIDFDRSLPAIAGVRSLELDSLAPVSLPEDAPLTLEPLAIADLPLTAGSISPR